MQKYAVLILSFMIMAFSAETVLTSSQTLIELNDALLSTYTFDSYCNEGTLCSSGDSITFDFSEIACVKDSSCSEIVFYSKDLSTTGSATLSYDGSVDEDETDGSSEYAFDLSYPVVTISFTNDFEYPRLQIRSYDWVVFQKESGDSTDAAIGIMSYGNHTFEVGTVSDYSAFLSDTDADGTYTVVVEEHSITVSSKSSFTLNLGEMMKQIDSDATAGSEGLGYISTVTDSSLESLEFKRKKVILGEHFASLTDLSFDSTTGFSYYTGEVEEEEEKDESLVGRAKEYFDEIKTLVEENTEVMTVVGACLVLLQLIFCCCCYCMCGPAKFKRIEKREKDKKAKQGAYAEIVPAQQNQYYGGFGLGMRPSMNPPPKFF